MTECAVEGCERDVKALEWCHMHYQRWRAHDDPTYIAQGIHLPFEPLWDAVRPEDQGDLATRVGFSRRSVMRWKRDGVPMLSADAIACAVGMHPSAIWGPDWDGMTTSHPLSTVTA